MIARSDDERWATSCVAFQIPYMRKRIGVYRQLVSYQLASRNMVHGFLGRVDLCRQASWVCLAEAKQAGRPLEYARCGMQAATLDTYLHR